jgi:tetratricopeptide (TPR) repeat protein
VLRWDRQSHTPLLRRPPISDRPAAPGAVERSRIVQHEIVQLVLLGLAATTAFFLTSAIASSNRDMNLRDGEEWYRRGVDQLQQQELNAAIDSFRRAAARNRVETRYQFALADALARAHQYDVARGVLITLRESAPDNAEITLRLARLAAERQDVTEALRFYHSALYAPWTAEQAAARQGVRLELIDFLLDHEQTDRALSELLALTADLPDTAAAHIQAGKLFARGGDNRRALEQFQRALRLEPLDPDALAAAGQAAFESGEYLLARRYLRAIPNLTGSLQSTRDIVELVVSRDPLANGLRTGERTRRAREGLAYALKRLNDCATQHADKTPSSEELSLRQEGQALEKRLERPGGADLVEDGVDVAGRIERSVMERCQAEPMDRALALVAQAHGGDRR